MKQFISFIRKEFFHIFRDKRIHVDFIGYADYPDYSVRLCDYDGNKMCADCRVRPKAGMK